MLDRFKERIKYYFERSYPYVFSGIVLLLIKKQKIGFLSCDNLDSALDAVNTLTALIIGFLGAILPVILGMKNESKFVKYVFEKDKEKLFLKYIKITIIIGLLLALTTISMYFVSLIQEKEQQILLYVWIFLICSFLLSTYRSLSNMLNLIFSNDSVLDLENDDEEKKSEEEIELENYFKM